MFVLPLGVAQQYVRCNGKHQIHFKDLHKYDYNCSWTNIHTRTHIQHDNYCITSAVQQLLLFEKNSSDRST